LTHPQSLKVAFVDSWFVDFDNKLVGAVSIPRYLAYARTCGMETAPTETFG
jgi:hypothetical protein